MRILVVDDSEDWRELTGAALLAAGYDDVITAGSATDAYGKLGLADRPGNGAALADLVVLDLVMPGIDGIEACARIRSDPRYGDVPVIVVTTASDTDALSNAFVAGATDFIAKPFDRVELLVRVRSALKIKAEFDRRKARESELISLSRTNWGDRDPARWVDDVTNLFVGKAAEAYLAAQQRSAGPVSVFAIGIDRLDALTATRGQSARDGALARIADAVASIGAPIGVIAACYPDGVIVLVAPRLHAAAARVLGEALRSTVRSPAIASSEVISADAATVSVGLITARQARADLAEEARRLLKDAVMAGGNRIASVDVSSN